MGLLLLIILVLFLVGGLPRWGYHSYGYAPSSFIGVLVIVFIVLLLAGRV
jgi:hypothetical protein